MTSDTSAPADHDTLTSRQEWRAYWPVVLGVFLAMATGYAAWTFVQSLLIKPLAADFGWTRSQIAVAFSANGFLVFIAPLMGRVVDRIGVRPVLVVCMTGIGVCYLGLANMGGVYPLFVGLHIALYVFGIGTTGVAFTRAVTSWFARSLGAALAVSRIGLSLLGAALPIVVFHLIAGHGWQAGYYTLAALALLVGLPVSWFLVRDRRPTRVAGQAAGAAARPGLGDWLELIRNHRVLLLSVAAACTYAPTVGVLSQLQPLLTDKGLDPALAAEFAGLLVISVVAGTLITGFLVDRIWAPLVACVFTLAPVIGLFLLLPARLDAPAAAAAVILIGLAQGAEIDVVAYMVSRYFGMSRYALIYGLGVMFIGLGAAAAAVLFAASHDVLKSYNPALMGAAVVFVLGAVCYLALGRYPKPAAAAT
jgi:predicted MFS family arabinose efflux permease